MFMALWLVVTKPHLSPPLLPSPDLSGEGPVSLRHEDEPGERENPKPKKSLLNAAENLKAAARPRGQTRRGDGTA